MKSLLVLCLPKFWMPVGREWFVTQVFLPDTDDSSDDEDDFLSTAKDQSKYLGNIEEDEEAYATPDLTLDANTTNKKANKVVTKAAVAKKLAKMNLQVNTRIEFTEDGEPVLDPTKQQVQQSFIFPPGCCYYRYDNIILPSPISPSDLLTQY